MFDNKSTSRQEDDRRSERSHDRVTKTHGGEIVESISIGELESFNDADCKHERLIRDTADDEYITFICANDKCSEVVIFNK